ncbi:hypothetical protein PLESTM_000483500 [Pleodorina starrii]|nr:hypothetical protein PLESTM_000483500 [Pleodorina starrii]
MSALTISRNALYKTRTLFAVELHPSTVDNVLEGVKEQLNANLLRYVDEIDGVLVAYSNIEILTKKPVIHPYFPYFHLDVRADVLVFKPAPGMTLVGRVNHIGEDYMSALVLGVFNVTIPARSVMEDLHFLLEEAKWIHTKQPQHQIAEHSYVVFKVEDTDAPGLRNGPGSGQEASAGRGASVQRSVGTGATYRFVCGSFFGGSRWGTPPPSFRRRVGGRAAAATPGRDRRAVLTAASRCFRAAGWKQQASASPNGRSGPAISPRTATAATAAGPLGLNMSKTGGRQGAPLPQAAAALDAGARSRTQHTLSVRPRRCGGVCLEVLVAVAAVEAAGLLGGAGTRRRRRGARDHGGFFQITGSMLDPGTGAADFVHPGVKLPEPPTLMDDWTAAGLDAEMDDAEAEPPTAAAQPAADGSAGKDKKKKKEKHKAETATAAAATPAAATPAAAAPAAATPAAATPAAATPATAADKKGKSAVEGQANGADHKGHNKRKRNSEVPEDPKGKRRRKQEEERGGAGDGPSGAGDGNATTPAPAAAVAAAPAAVTPALANGVADASAGKHKGSKSDKKKDKERGDRGKDKDGGGKGAAAVPADTGGDKADKKAKEKDKEKDKEKSEKKKEKKKKDREADGRQDAAGAGTAAAAGPSGAATPAAAPKPVAHANGGGVAVTANGDVAARPGGAAAQAAAAADGGSGDGEEKKKEKKKHKDKSGKDGKDGKESGKESGKEDAKKESGKESSKKDKKDKDKKDKSKKDKGKKDG